jgi:hypothetical protein
MPYKVLQGSTGYRVKGAKGRYQVWVRRADTASVNSSQSSAISYQLSLTRSPGTKYQVSAIRYQLSAIRYQLSGISYQLSGISYQVSAISYQVSAISYQVSGIS